MQFGEAVPRVSSVAEAIERMGELDEALVDGGVRHFNRLYREVTVEIHEEIAAGKRFVRKGFVDDLDVNFANRYFDALRLWFAGDETAVPLAWMTLFRTHLIPRITPVQFAAAGVNTHINFDLPWALTETWQVTPPVPGDGRQREEYLFVNRIFDRLYSRFCEDLFEVGYETFTDEEIRFGVRLAGHVVVNNLRAAAWRHAKVLRRLGEIKGALGRYATKEFSESVFEEPACRIGELLLTPVGNPA